MASKNKFIVNFWVESGNNPKEEVDVSWKPINFEIYSDLFPDMIKEAVNNWIEEHDLNIEQQVEVIFEHIREYDGAGALMDEYFTPIHSEWVKDQVLHFD